jgi:hypothetical protein
MNCGTEPGAVQHCGDYASTCTVQLIAVERKWLANLVVSLISSQSRSHNVCLPLSET